MAMAEYALQALQQAGIAAWRNQDALTVLFPQPPQKNCHKWQLASENGTSHLICMPGVTIQHIDAFVYDYKEAIAQSVSWEIGLPVLTQVI
jgi:histidine decarboxylase